jgi:hypothetical protein
MRAPPAEPFGDLPPAARRRLAIGSVLRSLLVGTILVVGYFALPMTHLTAATGAFLAIGLVVLTWLLGWQLRAVASSPYPRLRAVGALVTSVPLFFVVFATTYFLMEESTPGSFNEPLSRLDAIYFVVTVFATVGFGDIVPVTEPARAVVLLQMLGDLVVVGFVARAFVGALQRGLRRRSGD